MPLPTLHACLWIADDFAACAKTYAALAPDTRLEQANAFLVTIDYGDSRVALMNAGPQYRPNPTLSLYLTVDDEAHARAAWRLLEPGGRTLMPLQTYAWSTCYGWIEDRWGTSWQVSVPGEGERLPRVAPALMYTGEQLGRAVEAVALYTAVIPDSGLVLARSASGNDPGLGDPFLGGPIGHAQFDLAGQRFLALDSALDHGGIAFTPGASVMVCCDTQAEIDQVWDGLTAGGGAPGRCGWLTDRFGVSWQVIPRRLGEWMSNPVRAGAVGTALRAMGKLEIEVLEAAK